MHEGRQRRMGGAGGVLFLPARDQRKALLPWMRAPVSRSRVGGLVTCLQLQQVPLRDSVSHGQACTHRKRQAWIWLEHTKTRAAGYVA